MKFSNVARPIRTNFSAFKAVRKPMPQPSQVMGEGKRKNIYRRKEKFNSDTMFDFC